MHQKVGRDQRAPAADELDESTFGAGLTLLFVAVTALAVIAAHRWLPAAAASSLTGYARLAGACAGLAGVTTAIVAALASATRKAPQ